MESGEKFLLECGDCGCVRQVAIVIEDGTVGIVGIALKVDEAETASRRAMAETQTKIHRMAEAL